jgi:hypothetical protein
LEVQNSFELLKAAITVILTGSIDGTSSQKERKFPIGRNP